jgi:hypothetical protein
MSLQKQLVDLRPAGGLQQQVSKFVQAPFHELDNLVYDKLGAIQKRPPIRALTSVVMPTTEQAIDAVVGVVGSPSGELLLMSLQNEVTQTNPGDAGANLWSYSESNQRWRRKSGLPSIQIKRLPGSRLQGNPVPSAHPQVARVGTYQCVLYQDTSGGFIRVVDLSTGTVLVDNTQLPSSLTGGFKTGKIHLIECNDGLFTFVYVDPLGNQFRRTTLDPTTLVYSSVNVGVSFATTLLDWDCCPLTTGTFALTAVERSVGTSLLRVNNATGVVTHTVTESGDGGEVSVNRGFSGSAFAVVMCWSNATDFRIRRYAASNLAPTSTNFASIPLSTFPGGVANIACSVDQAGRLHAVACGFDGVNVRPFTAWQARDVDLFFSTSVYRIPWSFPQSKPFTVGNAHYLLTARFRDAGQLNPPGRYGYALLNLNRLFNLISSDIPIQLEAAFAYADGVGGDFLHLRRMMVNIDVGGDVAVLPISIKGLGAVTNNTWADVIEVTGIDANLPSGDLWRSAYASKLLHLSGSLVLQYDGQSLVEAGFLEPPQIAWNEPPIENVGSSTSLAPGTYSWLFTWEWFDAQGNRHESRASEPYTRTVSASPGATVSFTLSTTATTRRGSAFDGIEGKPRLVMYRTKVNSPGLHYRVPIGAIPNNPQALTLSVTDIYSDTLVADALLGVFTGDSLLEADVPPPCKHVQASGGRVWVTSTEKSEVWPSLELIEGQPPTFNAGLRITLDDAATPIVATSYVDGVLVIFTEDRVYTLSAAGSGPSDSGEGSWGRPFELQATSGCVSSASVVAFDQGVFYRDKDGFKVITRNRDVSPVGEFIRDITDEYPLTIDTVVDPKRERIYTLLSKEDGSQILAIYDFRHNAWSTASTSFEDDGEPQPWTTSRMSMWRDEPVFSYRDSAHTMSDKHTLGYDGFSGQGDTWITAKMATPWVLLQNVGGYQRVWRAHLEMENLSPHGFTVRFYNDGEEGTPVQQEVWTPADVAALQGLPRQRITVGVAIQKCQSWKMAIQDSPPTTPAAGNPTGFRYHGATLELGIKRNLEKSEKANTRLPMPLPLAIPIIGAALGAGTIAGGFAMKGGKVSSVKAEPTYYGGSPEEQQELRGKLKQQDQEALGMANNSARQAAEARGMEGDAYRNFATMAAGEGPSVGRQIASQAAATAGSQAQQMAASARGGGGNQLLAQRAAARAGADATMKGAATAAQVGAQEQIAAMNAMGDMASKMRAGDDRARQLSEGRASDRAGLLNRADTAQLSADTSRSLADQEAEMMARTANANVAQRNKERLIGIGQKVLDTSGAELGKLLGDNHGRHFPPPSRSAYPQKSPLPHLPCWRGASGGCSGRPRCPEVSEARGDACADGPGEDPVFRV